MASQLRPQDRAPELPAWPFVIGLLGGVAAGKSSIAGILESGGYLVLDADAAAHRVLQEAELRPWIRQTFGARAVRGNQVDRTVVAEQVFRDPQLRERLEAQIHPRVLKGLRQATQEALARGLSVVLDVPLLLESSELGAGEQLRELCDLLLFVEVPEDLRRERALNRGLAEDDWRRREAAQIPVDEKRRQADLIVHNEGSLERSQAELAGLLAAARAARASAEDKNSGK